MLYYLIERTKFRASSITRRRRSLRFLGFSLALLALSSLGLYGASPKVRAGQDDDAELRRILQSVNRNLTSFEAALPDFVCHEEIKQEITTAKGQPVEKHLIISELTGRQLKKHTAGVAEERFQELRGSVTIDGKKQKGNAAIPPPKLEGAFSSILLSHFSIASLADFDWRLAPQEKSVAWLCYVLEFQPIPNRNRQSYDYDGREYDSRRNGKAFVEKDSLQVVRIEFQENNLPDLLTRWTSSVDYGPVKLDNQTFWLPVLAVTELRDKQTGQVVRATHHYSAYKRFQGEIQLVDK